MILVARKDPRAKDISHMGYRAHGEGNHIHGKDHVWPHGPSRSMHRAPRVVAAPTTRSIDTASHTSPNNCTLTRDSRFYFFAASAAAFSSARTPARMLSMAS